jgi:hypothetical protein
LPQTTLTPGASYVLVLSQSGNAAFGPTLGDGFASVGNPTFSSQFGCSNGMFCDVATNNRNGNWALDISGVTSATDTTAVTATPEPGSMLLLASGMLALILFARQAFAGLKA